MPLESIVDPAITIKPTTKLIDFILNIREKNDAPIGIASLHKYKKYKKEKIANATLKIEDLRWLNKYLGEYRKTATKKVYLHELFNSSDIILPSPKVTSRNPELEARIQRLMEQQNAREYRAMTKSIDSVRKFLPEDSIAYQSKQLYRIYNLSYTLNHLYFFSNIILFYSETDKQTTHRCCAICIFRNSWLCLWIHRSRTHSRELRLWIQIIIRYNLCINCSIG